ncbi:MAG: S8 family peptidase [Elusimicrobia bacterium]|nr:S8 family peptidase [Elusimicrobiota bacterium]
MKLSTTWAALAIILFSGAAQAQVTAAGTRNLKTRFLVAFKQGAASSDKSATLEQMGLSAIEQIDELGAVVVEGQAGKFQASAAAGLASDPNVAWVEQDQYWPNMLVDMAPASFAQIPLPALQEIMAQLPKVMPSQTDGELPWGIRRVNAPAAWPTTQGEGVRVAVVDTGIDFKHPDLASNYAGGYNAIDSSKTPMDDNGHGTHVAGTIAAVKDGKGVAGVAPKARLYAVKVLDKDGGGGLVSIIKGLIWCGRNHIQVANMSLGAPISTPFMHWAVMYAAAKGVTIVAAAGNSGGSVSYPGAYSEVIAISAADARDKIAEWSSRGKEVAFIAPGVDVLSDWPGGGLETESGTSMATPHMAGLAALAVSQGASTPAQVRKALEAAAVKVDGLSATEQGHGMVDAAKLIKKK